MTAGGGATAANQVIEIGLLTIIDADTSAISANTPTLGQKTMAGSSPVVIASDQSAIAVATNGLTDAQLRATPVPVSGTVSVTGVATAANQATEIASLASIDSKLTSPLTVTGPLTDVQLRATPVPVSGTVSTGGLTDAQLRASPVPVSGTVTANAGTGTFAISAAALPLPSGASSEVTLASIDSKLGTLGQKAMAGSAPVVIASDQSAIAVTGPLTDAQLRASPVPISGSVTSTPIVNTAGSYDEITNLTTSAQTFTAPANAVGFLLEALSSNTVNLRWKAGAAATTTSGMRLEPGRDTGYLPMKANISIITESGSSQVATIQWILSS